MKTMILVCAMTLNLGSAAVAGPITAGGPSARTDTVCVDENGFTVVKVVTTRFGGSTRLATVKTSSTEGTSFKANKIPVRIAGKWALYASDDRKFRLMIDENSLIEESNGQFHASLTAEIDGQEISSSLQCSAPVIADSTDVIELEN